MPISSLLHDHKPIKWGLYTSLFSNYMYTSDGSWDLNMKTYIESPIGNKQKGKITLYVSGLGDISSMVEVEGPETMVELQLKNVQVRNNPLYSMEGYGLQ